MYLIIDIGNTNVKLGLFDNNNLVKKTTYDLNNQQDLKSILLDCSKLEYIFFSVQYKYALNSYIFYVLSTCG